MLRSFVTQAHAEELFSSCNLTQDPSTSPFMKQEKEPNMYVSLTSWETSMAGEPWTPSPNTSKRLPPEVAFLLLCHGKSVFALCWCLWLSREDEAFLISPHCSRKTWGCRAEARGSDRPHCSPSFSILNCFQSSSSSDNKTVIIRRLEWLWAWRAMAATTIY